MKSAKRFSRGLAKKVLCRHRCRIAGGRGRRDDLAREGQATVKLAVPQASNNREVLEWMRRESGFSELSEGSESVLGLPGWLGEGWVKSVELREGLELFITDCVFRGDSHWERWLDRGEPMAVMMVYGGEEQEKLGKEVRKLSNQWHKENRDRIGQRCAGVAMVLRSSKLMAIYKPIVARATKKRMGCPGQVFDNREEARAWLEERLSEETTRQAV